LKDKLPRRQGVGMLDLPGTGLLVPGRGGNFMDSNDPGRLMTRLGCDLDSNAPLPYRPAMTINIAAAVRAIQSTIRLG
jgi:hypothetical protein